MSGAGKGDARRPCQVPPETLAERWARTFGKSEPQPDPNPETGSE